MSRAFVFPGQGSQSVGMMASMAEAHPVVRETFDAASRVLGYDLWALAQQGPAEQLALTEITQPVMLVAGVATYRAWRAAGGAAPDWVAGHSLGEFTALVAAGTLRFEDAVDLVRVRGELMRDAMPGGQGGMAAVLGLEDAGQVVIAGHRTALERAIEGAKAQGAKRALPLPISVPCHSSLMRPAAERLRARLASSDFSAPTCRFLSSVDAHEYRDPEAIRDLLYRQLASPVRWVATVRALVAAGVTEFIECGPGKVLAGLNRRIDKTPGVSATALEDPASLTTALAGASPTGGAA
jgi:[acyl-carrier-protein] S-malonyltransferase